MGIAGCSPKKVLWIATGLTLKSIQDLNLGNLIDTDGNTLTFTLGRGKSIPEILNLMAKYLKELTFSGGFRVTVILDGSIRPDCKRDSWNRKKSRELDDINRMFCRFKAVELRAKIESGSYSEEDKKDVKKYSEESRKLENRKSKGLVLPHDFGHRLSEKRMIINAIFQKETSSHSVYETDGTES